MDNITTEYLEGFITYLQDKGLAAGTIRLHFQKLSCVLHEAYREELFDERILLRAKRPKREQEKRKTRLMCHSDIGTTKIYADLTCRAKSKALKKLPVINVSA